VRVRLRGELNGSRGAGAVAGQLPRRAARQADFRARRTRRLLREDPRAKVGEDVRVGVGPVEFIALNKCQPFQRYNDGRPSAACDGGRGVAKFF